MFVEVAVIRPAKDMSKHDKSNMFFLPREEESASVARISPPTRQPMKKHEAGNPLMSELVHSSDQSDTIDVSIGISQVHEVFGSWHISVKELHRE